MSPLAVGAGLLLGAGAVLAVSPWLWPGPAARTPVRPLRRLDDLLRAAGMPRVPPALLLVLAGLLGLTAAALALALGRMWGLAGAVGLLAAVLPLAAVAGRARRRRRVIRAAWPDLVDHLVASLRAGMPLATAVGSLAVAGAPETRSAFAAFERQVQASGVAGPALDELKRELADPIGDRVVETLRLAREVGGTELPAVLRALAASLRADAAVRAEAEARQSWVVVAARLGVAAPWVVLVLLGARPEALEAYNSPAGLALLAGALVVTIVAYRIMLALGRLPQERRWFA